ncbi:MAG: RHS repeat domain-containing protein, partial [Polaribacter sp.]
AQKFGYNGVELEESLGLNLMEMDFRQYDPSTGRFMLLDPLAELMRRHSPYNYAFDNPIYFIDPDGMSPIGFEEMDGHKNFDFYDDSKEFTSVIVNNKGEITDYKDDGDDGDDNIYLNTRSEENIIGTETKSRKYIVGNYIYANDIDEDAELPNDFIVMLSADLNKNNVIGGPGLLELIGPGGILKWKSVVSFFKGFSLWRSTRIAVGSLKGLKLLIKQLSKPGLELTKKELKNLEKLVEKFGGKLRKDLNPVKGKIKKPHVQVEGLGKSIESRHVWLKSGVK